MGGPIRYHKRLSMTSYVHSPEGPTVCQLNGTRECNTYTCSYGRFKAMLIKYHSLTKEGPCINVRGFPIEVKSLL